MRFVMPGRGEGFGIVYLEAMACGVPVVASSADASREAVRDGQLGVVVDPDDPEDLKRGIYRALDADRGRRTADRRLPTAVCRPPSNQTAVRRPPSADQTDRRPPSADRRRTPHGL